MSIKMFISREPKEKDIMTIGVGREGGGQGGGGGGRGGGEGGAGPPII